MSPTLVLAGLLLVGMPSAVQDYDPTDPSQVAESEAKPSGTAEGLAGPAVDPSSMGRGDGNRDNEMMAGMMTGLSVEAMLESKCGRCHGQQNQKAGVQVIPVESMFTGPQKDWVVIPGQPRQSILLDRISLPAGHDDIMPPEGRPLTSEQVTAIEQWIAGGAKAEAAREGADLPMSAGPGRRRSQRIPSRTWMRIYLELDLTPEQRSSAVQSGQELQREVRAFQDKHGKEMQQLQQKIRSFADRSNPTENLLKLRQQLQTLQAKQPKTNALQESLWNALTPPQQEAMRVSLAERTGRDGRGDGKRGRGARRGGDRPDDGMDEATRRRLRLLMEERRKAREQNEVPDTSGNS